MVLLLFLYCPFLEKRSLPKHMVVQVDLFFHDGERMMKKDKLPNHHIQTIHHSVLKLTTGLASAALTAWMLIVRKAMSKAMNHPAIMIQMVNGAL